MTTYRIPTEPNVKSLWTLDPNDVAVEWVRTQHLGSTRWNALGQMLTWYELLVRSRWVYDQHPDQHEDYPLPWSVDERDEERIVDEQGELIVDCESQDLAAYIVRIVNQNARRAGLLS